MQLIRPLRIKESCLRCHAEEGYKVGDIRGGLTISIPMESVRGTQRKETIGRVFGYGGIWFLGLCGIALMSRHLRQQVAHRYEAEQRLREAHNLLEKRVVERTAELAEVNRQLQAEIVDRRQAEQWLLESEERFRGYFEQGLVGMAILSAEKEWVEVNNRLCTMLGHTEAELVLKPLEQFIAAGDRPAVERHVQQLLGGVVRDFVINAQMVCKDGRVFPAGLSVQCLKKSDGTTDCLLILVQDMSHRQSV
jgi:PAS domain S-box-containing protein